MNILEFENTQGITLRYNTATVFDRSISYLIDLLLLGIFIGILVLAFQKLPEVMVAMITVPVFFFYSLLMELLNDGQSVGKMIMGLKVVRIDGKYPTGYDYFMRWIFRWVDIYMSIGSFAALLVAATPRNQRIGDMLADTTVIRTRNLRVPLKRILRLSALSTYKPKYSEAVQLSETQVLLAKETLQRFNKFKNKPHGDALEDLSIRISKILNIEKKGNAPNFIQTIIKDYIALTR